MSRTRSDRDLTERAIDAVLIAGSTARLTRFVTTDTLGDWLLVRPLKGAAVAAVLEDWGETAADVAANELINHGADHSSHPAVKAASGLDCPFCAGTWIGFSVLASHRIARAIGPRALAAWRFVAGGLTLNYVVGHTSARID